MTELRTMTFEKVDDLYKIYCEIQDCLVALSAFMDDFGAMPERRI